MKVRFLAGTLLFGLLTVGVQGRPDATASYAQAIQQTTAMVSDPQANQLAGSHGLQILNLTWEDTGRFKNSAVGPNISDMTLQVGTTALPVVRFPNFSDKTADLKLEHFYVKVGNERGKGLRKVNLRDYLGNLREHLSSPASWKGKTHSLLAARDSHVLVSAQACFLPIPKQGKATFNPVLFNYQSSRNNPAVLAIVATREGTSATVIDNTRDGFAGGGAWGQRLFFNQSGKRASFTGQRVSDFRPASTSGAANTGQRQSEPLNAVLLIQVPLKHREFARKGEPMPCSPSISGGARTRRAGSDVEAAVIGHGKVEGPYTEMDNLAIERDERFPIRVTVQFYQATSNGVVSGKDMARIAAQLNRVYAQGDYVGSLVSEGETGRPSEYHGNDKTQPRDWWKNFWRNYNGS